MKNGHASIFFWLCLVDCIAVCLVITVNLVSSLCYNNFTNLEACQLVWKHLDTTSYIQLKRRKNVNPSYFSAQLETYRVCKGKALGDDYSICLISKDGCVASLLSASARRKKTAIFSF